VLAHDTRRIGRTLTPPEESQEPKKIRVSYLKPRTIDDIDEAWANLDAFPAHISKQFRELKFMIFNFDNSKGKLGEEISISFNMQVDAALDDFRKAASEIARVASSISKALDDSVEQLEP
jgi:hypothetical protein